MNQYDHNPATTWNEKLFRLAVEDTLMSIRGEVLVDVGSGDGRYSRRLGDLLGAKQVYCLDHDVQVFEAMEASGRAMVADLNNKLPIREEIADVVLANQVIEHVVKTDLMVKEMYRILKPGGRVVVCTPNLASWHNVLALSLGWLPFSMQVSDEYFIGNPKHPNYKSQIYEMQAHLRVFTHKALEELLYIHGFDEVKMRGVGYYPFGGKAAEILAELDWRHSAYILATAIKN